MIKLPPFKTRPIRFLELWTPSDAWRIKVYGIAAAGPRPDACVIDAAKRVAAARLAQVNGSRPQHGVGFLGIHQGMTGCFVFIDWWSVVELNHHLYHAPLDDPDALKYHLPDNPIACVWDLKLISHERDAWVDCVLNNPAGPDLDAYLARQLNAEL
jgi:hypothetical protein